MKETILKIENEEKKSLEKIENERKLAEKKIEQENLKYLENFKNKKKQNVFKYIREIENYKLDLKREK